VSESFLIADRFRGFLSVIVDVETGGFNCKTDALLEIAAVLIDPQEGGTFPRSTWYSCMKQWREAPLSAIRFIHSRASTRQRFVVSPAGKRFWLVQ